MKRLLSKAAIGALLALTAAIASAATPATLNVETIGVEPFGITAAGAPPTGMMFEIGNKIAEEAGFKPSNKVVPYARTVEDLADGTADFVLRFGNEKINAVSVDVGPVVKMSNIVLAPPGATYPSLASLHGKTVGKLRGGSFDDAFDADAAIKKYDINDYGQLVQMLMAGRVDAAIGSAAGIYYVANKKGLKQKDLGAAWIISSRDFKLFYSKKTASEATTKALAQAIDRLNKRGDIKKIVSKYMGEFQWEAPADAKK